MKKNYVKPYMLSQMIHATSHLLVSQIGGGTEGEDGDVKRGGDYNSDSHFNVWDDDWSK